MIAFIHAFDKIERSPNTLDAHRLIRWAQASGKQTDVVERLFNLYFTQGKTAKGGGPRDSVARFHLGNGARLERINWHGDLSKKGLAQAHGLMVNYLYELDDIEANHEAFADRGEIITSGEVRQLLKRKASGLRATPEAAAG